MATYGTTIRRGLPRVAGGDPYPPDGAAPLEVAAVAAVAASVASGEASGATSLEGRPEPVAPTQETAAEPAAQVVDTGGGDEAPAPAAAGAAGGVMALRRGLPRTPGGEPWPPAGAVAAAAEASVAGSGATSLKGRPEPVAPTQETAAEPTTAVAERAERDAPAAAAATAAGGVALRRGLPRTPGGEPWPPAGLAAPAPASAAPVAEVQPRQTVDAATTEATSAAVEQEPAAPVYDVSTPLPFTRTVWAGASAATRPAPKPEPARIGPFTKAQWAGIVVVGGGALVYAGLMAVLAVRWLLSTPWGIDLLAAFPGEYHLPEGAPVGFPAWLGWQHFFNVFLMVLIIRSGLTIRTEKRPTAFWTPRGNPKGKVSLTIWFHQALDLLWILNGVAFVVLLFVTGQWMRIVPTSWEVFPNAFSAALQYVSLDWPTENGWVNYNSLQQLAYFTTVFLAAPLAIATGFRMSGWWPKNAKALSKAYPIEWARAVHFPVMLYFVAFIIVHVALVFATGALRNLNHMYAAQGSVDPNAYADNWAGFWIFIASIVVIAAAWTAARPLVLAPIARLFGTVSGR
ncbi:hypothetical protein GCM10022200_23920 [Microbacterium awajiense]|uniref:Cytochrome b561 bacterial/Ni-hydrogenase domain-containing protein n=1 Tax=Microbacterium awajiense TaxID=415214 RepID=A0ABP7ATY9_9MICO